MQNFGVKVGKGFACSFVAFLALNLNAAEGGEATGSESYELADINVDANSTDGGVKAVSTTDTYGGKTTLSR